MRGILASIEQPSQPSTSRSPFDDFWYTANPRYAESGIAVTPEAAETLSAVWQAVNLRSQAIASMPCLVYERLEKGRRRARTHPLFDVLHRQPNRWQTAFEFWEMAVQHVDLRGNFYAEIVDGPRGFADQLIPRSPDRMSPKLLPSGDVQYAYRLPTGGTRLYTQDEIFHLRFRTRDGVTGLSTIDAGMNSIGGALAGESFAHRFYRQATSSAIAVIHPHELGEDGLKNLRESVTSYATGLKNAHGVLALEEDVKIHNLGVDPEKAQLILAREFGVEDVGRWFNLPLHLLRSNKQAQTYASLEVFSLELVTYTYRPIAVRFEQAILRDLILATDRFFAEFLMDALMRGDSKTRAEFYKALWGMGVYSANDILEKENANPVPGGDQRFVPANMIPMELAGTVVDRRATTDTRAALVVREAAARLVKKEIAAVTKAAQRFAQDAAGWQAWLRTFYDEHAGQVAQVLQISSAAAREYTARQGLALAESGVGVMADWEWRMPLHLAALALEPDTTEVA